MYARHPHIEQLKPVLTHELHHGSEAQLLRIDVVCTDLELNAERVVQSLRIESTQNRQLCSLHIELDEVDVALACAVHQHGKRLGLDLLLDDWKQIRQINIFAAVH